MEKILNPQDIETKLPHRFENFLVDRCQISEEGFKLFVNIEKGDDMDRDIFLVQAPKHTRLANCILAEVMALAAIICHGSEDPNQVAIFASISNFKITESFENADLTVNTTHKSSKQGFFRYFGEIYSRTGKGKASAQLMAYASNNVETSETENKMHICNKEKHSKMVLPIPYKSQDICCINSIEYEDSKQIISAYRYPLAHPLIKGHFPHKPIMMGVMQWMMVEDALYYWVNKHSEHFTQSQHTLSCEAVVYNEEQHIICEVSKAAFQIQKNENGSFFVECSEAKRIFFRSIVTPGSLLYCDVSISKIDEKILPV